MSAGSNMPKKFLTLKQFMLRQEVLKLYRDILRTTKNVDEKQKSEIISWARNDFEQNRHQTDEVVIKGLLYNGKLMLKELQSSIKKSK